MSYEVIIEAFSVSGPVGILVFVTLLVLSVVCWGLIISTLIQLDRLTKIDKLFFDQFNQADQPKDLFDAILKSKEDEEKKGGLKTLFVAVYNEVVTIEKNIPGLNFIDPKMAMVKSNFDETINRTLRRVRARENSKRERFFGVFATTSNVAPFIGLMGTVIGIIDAFSVIGRAGNADLAFVAPAISEALVATALGLFVAIPASVAFNYFKAKSLRFSENFDHFSLVLLNRIQQQFFLKSFQSAEEGNEDDSSQQ